MLKFNHFFILTETLSLNGEPLEYETSFLKMIFSLIGLLIVFFLTMWMLKKMSQGRLGFKSQNSSIKIIEKKALSPKSILYVVEIEGKKIVIAESQLEIKPLITYPENCQKE